MKTLTKNDILHAKDIQVEELEIPEWNGKVHIRTLSGKERDKFESDCRDSEGNMILGDFRARFACLVLSNEDGEPIFSSHDVHQLTKRSAKALDRILDVGMRLNGMSSQDMEAAIKNSEKAQSEDSGLD